MKRLIHSDFHKTHTDVGRLNFLKAAFLFLTLFSFSFSVSSYAGENFYDGDYKFEVIKEGEVSVALNYTPETVNRIIGDVIVPSAVMGYKVTEVATLAFYGFSNITSITIPEGVKSIGSYAFYSCSSLESVTIPEGVTSIGSGAFSDCSSLELVTIPEGVTSIGSGAFEGCSSLQSVTIGAENIPNGLFSRLVNLESVTLLEGVTSIGNIAFSDCSSLSSISIPASVTSIGNTAFDGCSGLKKAEFASVESLCAISFGDALANPLYYAKQLYIGNSKVTQLVIPESVTSIGDCAFVCCESITSVVIQGAVGSIGDYAFAGCTGIESLSYGGQNEPSFGEDAMGGVDNLSVVSVNPSYSSNKWGGYPVDMNYSYTAISETSSQEVSIFAQGKNIIIENADNEVLVYNAQGALVAHEKPLTRVEITAAESGIYVVKIGNKVSKVIL